MSIIRRGHLSRKFAFGSGRDGNFDIYVMDADGLNLTRLTNHPEWDYGPAWTAD